MTASLFPVAILAGGLATRMQPLTETLPKSLLDVNGHPFIEHQIKALQRQGIDSVVICAGHLGEKIQAYLGDGSNYNMSIEYSFDGDKLLGTGGALKKALPLLGEHFFVLYGDSYLYCDYPQIQAQYLTLNKAALMTVFENKGLWDKSNILFQDNEIKIYDKKSMNPEMKHIDYGLGVVSASSMADVSEVEPTDLADVYQHLLKQRDLGAFEVHERFYEIGSFSGLEALRRHLIWEQKEPA